MSILNINENAIDLGLIRYKLINYLNYHRIGFQIFGYVEDFTLSSEIENITESDLDNLVMYYHFDNPSNIFIIRERLVYRKGWKLIYDPCFDKNNGLRLLTLKDVMNF